MFNFINNIRFGLATNSSSSHSFVYYRDPIASTSMEKTNIDTEFGWNDFRLATAYEKIMYGLTQMFGQGSWVGRESGKELYEEYGHLIPELTEEDFTEAINGYVDHQSRAYEDFNYWVDLARNPHVVIYGGNDNGGDYIENHGYEGDFVQHKGF